MKKAAETEQYEAFLVRVRATGYLDHTNRAQLQEWIANDQRRAEIFRARETFLATLPDTPNVQIELRRTSESCQSASKDPFQRYLAALRCGSLYADGVSLQQIKEWEEGTKYRPQIDCAKADWKERIDHIQSIRPQNLRRGDKPPELVPTDGDANTLAFNAKILPNLEKDVLSGTLHTEATLAAMNLPSWADAIAQYARAADDPKHGTRVRAFFVELGKAVDSGRTLWDAKDELIFRNYFTAESLKKPLCQMTEEEGSKLVGITTVAYDKRLQRFGVKRKGGRPKKQDRKTRARS